MSDFVEVTVGIVGRAHGVRGELVVELRTDEPERRFVGGAALRAQRPDRAAAGQVLTVASTRRAAGKLLVGFDQINDRTAAEQLRGAELVVEVPADEVPSGADEYYDRALVGLEVRDHSGAPVGRVAEVLHGTAQELLVVDTDRDQRLVPFVRALVPVVDLAAGYLQVAEVGGLLSDEDEDL